MSDFEMQIDEAVNERLSEAEKSALRVPVRKLDRDMEKASSTLTAIEARYLVDSYYGMQEGRIRANNQIRALTQSGEPHESIAWLSTESRVLEESVKRTLGAYSANHPVGKRMRTVVGVGPVISAGLLAHIDITRAPTAGAIWRYAGLDPTSEWKKGEKRPHNASLKTLCWKLGESFVKVCNHKDAVYGKLYQERKEVELAKNEAGMFADQAAAKLEKFKIGKTTDAYKAYSIGKLPPAHIHARAKRVAVKMFLSHLHQVWYEVEFGKKAPVPYVFEFADKEHVHKIEPNW
tara:strand:+ start:283 stop:1155 length:873 start_codon:yes stop_codon:yes gene_type:complete